MTWKEVLLKDLESKYSCAKRIGVRMTEATANSNKFVVFNVHVRGNDDSIYSKNRDIWNLLPRGTSLAYDSDGNRLGTVQGLRKFGYVEDRAKLCYGDYDKSNYMMVLEKENGENAQISAFRYKGQLYWFAGSKNVHIVFHNADDLNSPLLSDDKYVFAKIIAKLVLDKYNNIEFQAWLADNSYTAVGEAILSFSQHIVDYGSSDDHIRFFAVTSDNCSMGNLTALTVPAALKAFSGFGLPTPWMSPEVRVGSVEYEELLNDIKNKQNSEGCVGYYSDKPFAEEDSHVVYMCKIKSLAYVLERSTRGCIIRGDSAMKTRNSVHDVSKNLFNDDEAAINWIDTRLDFLINFSGWLQVYRRENELHAMQIQREWLSLQNTFKSLPEKNWWGDYETSKFTCVIAMRGLPCSGKSMVARGLQYIFHSLGKTAIWLNQDEIGKRPQYLKAFRAAYESKPNFIIMDKSNRDAQNLQDIFDIMNGPFDYILNFMHPEDKDDFEMENTIKLCTERFHARGDSHRTLRSDADISMILGTFKRLAMNQQKLSHFTSNLVKVDMTMDKLSMLEFCAKSVLTRELLKKIDTQIVSDALKYSVEYENLLGEQNDSRYGYFAIFFRNIDVKPWLDLVPEQFRENKKLNDIFHVTLSYQGMFITPKDYIALSKLVKEERKTDVEVESLVYDDKCITARVEIADKTIPSTNKIAHITLALADGVYPVYSNELLENESGHVVKLDEPAILNGTVRGGNEMKFGNKAVTTRLPQQIKLKSKRIAVDIGNVIYQSVKVSDSADHVMEDSTVEVKGAFNSLSLLKKNNFDMWLLSYCGEKTEMATRERLLADKVDQIVPEDRWMFCRDRTLKPELMKKNQLELLIDDRDDTCALCRQQGMKAIVFGQGRTGTWEQVLMALGVSNDNSKESSSVESLASDLEKVEVKSNENYRKLITNQLREFPVFETGLKRKPVEDPEGHDANGSLKTPRTIQQTVPKRTAAATTSRKENITTATNVPATRPGVRAAAKVPATASKTVTKTTVASKVTTVKAKVSAKPAPAAAKRPAWDTKGRLADMEEWAKQLANELKQSKQNFDEVREQLQHNNEQVAHLEQFKQDLKKSVVASTKESHSEEQDIVAELKKLVSDKEEQLQKEKEHLLKVTAEEKDILQKRINLIAEEKELLEGKLKNAMIELDALKSAVAIHAATELSLKASITSLESKVNSTETELKNEKSTRETLETELEKARRDIEALELKIREDEKLRKQLHNTIQELKGNIRVFCRVRPLLPQEEQSNGSYDHLKFPDEDQKLIGITQYGESAEGKSKVKWQEFSFDRVFQPQSRQEDVFEEISQLVQSACDGYNVCIFAYGITGSGKTFTMEGNAENKGMIPLSVLKVWEESKRLEEKGWKFEMEGSFVEIYNETLRDLLVDPKAASKKKLEIKHDPHTDKTYIPGVTIENFTSPGHVQSLLKKAADNRSVAETMCNEASSRSHSIFMMKISGKNADSGEECEGLLNLIDLAGSERLSNSQATGDRLKETQAINKSLSSLASVFAAIGNGSSHIPFRDSKLTYLLQNSLGGNSKTLMFVNVNPCSANVSETLNSLRFATKVNNCHIGTAKKNVKL